VFCNLFFEAEPFAAILIAHRTHRPIQEFVLGHLRGLKSQNSRPKAESREGVLAEGFPTSWGVEKCP